MVQRLFRTVADFLEVPEEELADCVCAFRKALLRAKADRHKAVRSGLPADSVPFDTFTWAPNDTEPVDNVPVTRTTPVDELPLRPVVRFALREMHVYCLEDLSEVDERELACTPAVGAHTVQRVRTLLARVGLDFKPDEDPERRRSERNRLARKLAPEVRFASITDASDISELGLSPGAYNRCRRKGHGTVGLLRELTLYDIARGFGEREAREIIEVLQRSGHPLRKQPTPLELWRYGFLSREELVIPTDASVDIGEFAPWLGSSLVDRLRKGGVTTPGGLRAMLGEGAGRPTVHLGPKTRAKLHAFLASTERGVASESTGDSAASVVDETPVQKPSWFP